MTHSGRQRNLMMHAQCPLPVYYSLIALMMQMEKAINAQRGQKQPGHFDEIRDFPLNRISLMKSSRQCYSEHYQQLPITYLVKSRRKSLEELVQKHELSICFD